jgi:hypothetical protein
MQNAIADQEDIIEARIVVHAFSRGAERFTSAFESFSWDLRSSPTLFVDLKL